MRFYAASFGLLITLACGSGDPSNQCEAAPTYTTVVEQIVANRCASCHSIDRLGTARNGAPMELNFDDYAAITPNLSAFANAITSGTMPPRGNPDSPPSTTSKERTDVGEWRRCGYPE